MPLMDINDTQLFVAERGDGPPVLFTHSLFFSGEMYAPQIDALASRYRCITVDWRGQGRSAAPLGGYDVDNLGRDMLETLDALGVDRCHWVGSSVGGVVGIRLAAQYPDRIASLLVCGASARSEPAEKLDLYESLILDGFARDPGSVADRLVAILYGERFRADPTFAAALAAERAILLGCDGPTVARASAPILRRIDIRHMLVHVRCPTTVVVGAEDAANPPDLAREIADGIAGAVLEIMPGIGHQPNIEAPAAFGAIVERHLNAAR